MAAAWQVLGRSLSDLWDNVYLAAFCSLTWLVAMLLIVPGPPATVALFAVATQIAARNHFVSFGDYLRGIGHCFVLGWRWGLLNLAVGLVVLVDVRTVPQLLPVPVAAPFQLFFYLCLALWLLVNWLALAFLFKQERPDLLQALRNGALLAFKHPLFTSVVTIATALLLSISLLLLIINLLFGPFFAALVAVQAVADRLAVARTTSTNSTSAR